MALIIDPIIMKLMTDVVQAGSLSAGVKIILCALLACIGTFLGFCFWGLLPIRNNGSVTSSIIMRQEIIDLVNLINEN